MGCYLTVTKVTMSLLNWRVDLRKGKWKCSKGIFKNWKQLSTDLRFDVFPYVSYSWTTSIC